jgi:predicted tellurium resistance membrane protein TerC
MVLRQLAEQVALAEAAPMLMVLEVLALLDRVMLVALALAALLIMVLAVAVVLALLEQQEQVPPPAPVVLVWIGSRLALSMLVAEAALLTPLVMARLAVTAAAVQVVGVMEFQTMTVHPAQQTEVVVAEVLLEETR